MAVIFAGKTLYYFQAIQQTTIIVGTSTQNKGEKIIYACRKNQFFFHLRYILFIPYCLYYTTYNLIQQLLFPDFFTMFFNFVQEAAWVLSNIAANSIEHKKLIYSSDAVPLLLRLLSSAPSDIRKEVAYAIGNICVAPMEGPGKPKLILEHLVSLVDRGCLIGFIDLVRSADIEAARLGLQFLELVRKSFLTSLHALTIF